MKVGLDFTCAWVVVSLFETKFGSWEGENHLGDLKIILTTLQYLLFKEQGLHISFRQIY